MRYIDTIKAAPCAIQWAESIVKLNCLGEADVVSSADLTEFSTLLIASWTQGIPIQKPKRTQRLYRIL